MLLQLLFVLIAVFFGVQPGVTWHRVICGLGLFMLLSFFYLQSANHFIFNNEILLLIIISVLFALSRKQVIKYLNYIVDVPVRFFINNSSQVLLFCLCMFCCFTFVNDISNAVLAMPLLFLNINAETKKCKENSLRRFLSSNHTTVFKSFPIDSVTILISLAVFYISLCDILNISMAYNINDIIANSVLRFFYFFNDLLMNNYFL